GVTILTFLMVRLVPGDPVDMMFANHKPTPEERVKANHQLGLDRPLHIQLARYLGHLARGDMGVSIRSKRPVTKEIRLRIPNTLKLTAASMLVTCVLGVL